MCRIEGEGGEADALEGRPARWLLRRGCRHRQGTRVVGRIEGREREREEGEGERGRGRGLRERPEGEGERGRGRQGEREGEGEGEGEREGTACATGGQDAAARPLFSRPRPLLQRTMGCAKARPARHARPMCVPRPHVCSSTFWGPVGLRQCSSHPRRPSTGWTQKHTRFSGRHLAYSARYGSKERYAFAAWTMGGDATRTDGAGPSDKGEE